MNLDLLRSGTASDHDSVESTVPLMDGSLTLTQYAAVLSRFYRIVCAWDRWAAENAPVDLQGDVRLRRRSTLLEEDLRGLGCVPPVDKGPIKLFPEDDSGPATREVFLGRMYVMEGSTLGGQYIARFLEKHFGWESGQGDAYFRGYGADTMAHWRHFQSYLVALPESSTETVIRAAREMFRTFAMWMQDDATPATATEEMHPSTQ